MANSPFRVLRKYQKPILAVGVALLLLTWLVGDALFSGGPAGGAASRGPDRDEVIESWATGEITRGEFERRVTERNLLRGFLRRAKALAIQQVGEEAQADVIPIVPLQAKEDRIEEQVIRTKILADAARESGMAITDDAINSYLRAFVHEAVSDDELNGILGDGNSRSGFSMRNVFDALREEMLAHSYRASHQFLVGSTVPEIRFRDWLRVNDQVVVEVVGLNVSDFVGQVEEPSDAEIAEFYEKYKDRVAAPESLARTQLPPSSPGFMEPRRVRLEYVEADFEDFVARELEKVTEAQIADYYETKKKDFVRPKAGLTSSGDVINNPFLDADPPAGAPPSPDTASTPSGADPANDDLATEEPATEQPATEQPATAEAPAEEATAEEAPAEEATADPPAAEEDSAVEAPPEPPSSTSEEAVETEAVPGEEAAGEDPASEGPDGEQSASEESSSEESSSEESAGEESSSEESASYESASDESASDESAGEDPDGEDPDGEQEADTVPGDEGALHLNIAEGDLVPVAFLQESGDAETAADVDDSGGPALGEEAASDEAAQTNPGDPAAGETTEGSTVAAASSGSPPSPADEYYPLDMVRDQIRDTLARRKAMEQVSETIRKVMTDLESTYSDYEDAVAIAPEGKQIDPPAYDLKQVAEANGLRFAETALVTLWDLAEMPVGQSYVDSPQRQFPLADVVSVAPLHKAVMSRNTSFNFFVVVKLEDQPSRPSSLDDPDTRAEVVRQWKLEQARPLAEKKADELVATARDRDLTLSELANEHPEYESTLVDPFSWLTDDFYGNFRLSVPFGVEAAGLEFMRTTFELDEGEIGTAFNHDRTILYITRLIRHQKSRDELHKEYLGDAAQWARVNPFAFERAVAYMNSYLAHLRFGDIGATLVSDGE